MNLLGKGFNHATQEVRAIDFAHIISKPSVDKWVNPVNDPEHVELALDQAQLGHIDMNVTNLTGRELASYTDFELARAKSS